jgi:hypothetical protein
MPPFVIYGMLALGLISAFAFRIIIVLERVEPAWVRPAWRKNTIMKNRLIEKVRDEECLKAEDRDVVLYLLNSIKHSREDINYVVIFALSVLAIVTDLFLWYMK